MENVTTQINLSDYLSNTTELNITVRNFPLQSYYPILAAELALSITCLMALIAIYVAIGEFRTLPGKNVITISACLIVTYIFLSVDLLMRDSISRDLCEAVGIIVQTTFLASFFWTNVMSYDIMRTMASMKPDSERNTKYWKYSIYAWGMTLFCVIPTVVLDNVGLVPFEYKPNFGLKKCWLNGHLGYFIYFNVPVGMTLVANCVFFVMTARTIVNVRNATAILSANRHKKR